MKELKSTIVGTFLIALGAFFIYSGKVDIYTNNYVLYMCAGLIVLGVYLLFTTDKDRKKHFEIFIKTAKKKIDE